MVVSHRSVARRWTREKLLVPKIVRRASSRRLSEWACDLPNIKPCNKSERRDKFKLIC